VTKPADRAAPRPGDRVSEPAGRDVSEPAGRDVSEPAGRAAAQQASLAARPGGSKPHFTGRAAILAIVICAIALSLAYPVREYIAQRRQIDQLVARRNQIDLRLKSLEQERRKLHDPVYIEQLARDRLHMCLPTQMCYEIIDRAPGNARSTRARQDSVPWYARLWSSVQQANDPDPGHRQGTARRGAGTAGRGAGTAGRGAGSHRPGKARHE